MTNYFYKLFFIIFSLGVFTNCFADNVVTLDDIVNQQNVSDKVSQINIELAPSKSAKISSEISAKIKHIPFKEGQSFKKNDVLVQFECKSQKAQLDKAKVLKEQSLKQEQADKQLLELKSIGRVEYEKSVADYEKSVAEFKYFKALVDKCLINAPFSGTVAELKFKDLEYVETGKEIMEIMDINSLEIEFFAPSNLYSTIKVNQEYPVNIDETGKIYPARITRLGNKIDAISKTFKVFAKLNNSADGGLLPGMSGTIKLN